jgi:2-polyprenyl-3-methyl-5-hydroxy-6-metoxy-1,4-benzoquinol methylase
MPMTRTLESCRCPYCLEQANPGFTIGGIRFFSCPRCLLAFRAGLEVPENARRMRQYYENDFFRELAWDQLEGYRDEIFREALDRIEGQAGRGRLLDVGCGCGFFLREALARGWDVKGLDPSRESIDYLNAMLGDVGIRGTLEACDPGERYDVITMINVLDHLDDPWQSVKKAAALLNPGGLLYVRVPNGHFHINLFRVMRAWGLGNKAGRVVVFHNYAMSAGWLERMLTDQGLTGVEIRNAGISEFDGYRRPKGKARAMRFLRRAVWRGAKSIEHLSAGKSLWGPSLEVTARKQDGHLRSDNGKRHPVHTSAGAKGTPS